MTQSSPNFFGDCSQSGLEKIDWTVLWSCPNFFGDCTTVWFQNSRLDRTKISPVQSGPGPTVRSGQSNDESDNLEIVISDDDDDNDDDDEDDEMADFIVNDAVEDEEINWDNKSLILRNLELWVFV